MKKILVIVGHPRRKSLSYSIADKYSSSARKAGHEVRTLNLAEMKFDAILHDDYKRTENLESDLVKAKENIKWADHLVFIYPTWWGTMPALLKGFIDRVFLPGFAYQYPRKARRFNPFPQRLLKGKSARIITTVGGSKLLYMFFTNPGTWGLRNFVLYFSGIRPVRAIIFSMVYPGMKPERIKKILEKVERMGRKGR